MSLLLQVNQIHKEFLGVTAVSNLIFSVRGGETFGLLGPNGAGKTTAMRMIMNIIAPDQGEILLNDEPRPKIPNHRFGYLPEERGLYPGANVLEMLTYFGTLNNLSKRKAEVEAIRFLDRLGMVDFTDRKINQLSKGMQQKIQFVAAFLHDPDILILDEPFSGLDPINQIVLREILEEYKKKNKILIISTHQMEQAEKLCDHICLINQGSVILEGNLNAIKKKNRENAYLLSSDDDLSFLKEFSELTILEEGNSTYKFALNDSKLSISGILKKVEARAGIRKFEVMEPSLHDIFIQKVQEENGGKA
jgi:ABC-2 type transport system ATP-binding protein